MVAELAAMAGADFAVVVFAVGEAVQVAPRTSADLPIAMLRWAWAEPYSWSWEPRGQAKTGRAEELELELELKQEQEQEQ